MRPIHRRLALTALALSTLAIAGFADSSNGPNNQLAGQNRLYGGGGTDPGCFVPDIGFCRTATTDIAIDAHSTESGHGAYGDMNSKLGRHEQITCLAVDGNKAAIGGVIIDSPNAAEIGSYFLMFFVDGGTSGSDLASPFYNAPPDPTAWPTGFPYVCPSPVDGAPALGLIASYIPLVRGDLVIQDAR